MKLNFLTLTKFVSLILVVSGLGVTSFVIPNLPARADDPVDGAGNTPQTANDIGTLTNAVSFKDFVGNFDTDDYYKFNVSVATPVSVFLNGLSAGTQLELLDSNGNILQVSANNGTTWTSAINPGTTGGSITESLNVGTYYIRISPTTNTGNPLYKSFDSSYTVNLIPFNAPDTVTVAAKDSVKPGLTNYTADGIADQDTIMQAIEYVGKRGGGTVLLLEGTYMISNNVYVTYDNVTLTGVGWGTKLKLANGIKLGQAGLLRSAFRYSVDRRRKPIFYGQHFRHMSLDGNKGNGTNYTNGYANFGTYGDSSFDNMRVHDFPHYGFDPHEQSDTGTPTLRLTIKDSLADHNAVDGMTTDTCVDSIFVNNVVDANTRHGINIVTGAKNNIYLNNVVTNNGANGITVQPGSTLSRVSNENKLLGNIVKFNKADGIYVYLAKLTEIKDNVVALNAKYGIRNRSSSYSTITGNIVDDNGQGSFNTYPAIYLHGDAVVFSTNNLLQNNLVRASALNRYKWGIAEGDVKDDYNKIDSNTIQSVNIPFRLKGLNSTNTNNQIIP
ncbi:right-handed parallel beta-helix repeat-containing protein [Nostoc sphaeroides CHAB 2801]|uniref:NosD domain-containing protein n=1 Tax=Nostoc sphaeroides TaxID=446679 RepID=UPI000E4F8B9C|nr:right-handed parallel beta-helix repeat-containing protein [Nostoc sphaeroides]MCC5627613.1 right-handed parallel beta-helix repeat-containing protein [Nostoc sphaeroides CHAB 2801]